MVGDPGIEPGVRLREGVTAQDAITEGLSLKTGGCLTKETESYKSPLRNCLIK